MNKRITSLLLCFVMALSMLATAVPVLAANNLEFKVTADKTEAHPGDTVTYTFTMSAVQKLESVRLQVTIPEGLTYQDPDLMDEDPDNDDNEELEISAITKANYAYFQESTHVIAIMCTKGFTSASEVELFKLTFKVNESFTGSLNIGIAAIDPDDMYNTDGDNFDCNYNTTGAAVTVAPEPISAQSVSISENAISLKTGESKTLTATVTPNNSTDTVVWSTDNAGVASVNETTGEVTAASSIAPKKTATATITATAGGKTDTCVVTVNCVHSYTEETKNAAARKTPGTCTDKAVYYYSCAKCGEVEKIASHTFEGDKDANNHGSHTTAVINKTAATCTTEGYTGDTVCNGCHATVSTGTTIPKTAHTLGAWVTTDPNKHWKECSVCHGKVEENNHNWIEVVDIEPTFTATGVGHDACSDCGATKNIGKELPKQTHQHDSTTLKLVPYKAATCTTDGNNAYYVCTHCGKAYRDQTESHPTTAAAEIIVALGHDYTELSVVSDTHHIMKCSRCKLEKSAEPHTGGTPTCSQRAKCDVCKLGYGNTLPHTEVTDAAVAATCKATGKTEGKHCSVCNEVIVAQSTVDKLPHTEVIDAAVAATCTTTGLTQGKHCSVCNEVIVAQTIVPATGHNWEVKVDTPATEEAAGISHEECSVCHTKQKENTVIPKLDHTHNMERVAAKAPTCTAEGNNEYYHCTKCDQYYKDSTGTVLTSVDAEKLAMTAHTYEWKTVTPATKDAEGSAEEVCSVCGHKSGNTKVLEKLPADPIKYKMLEGATQTVEQGNKATFKSEADFAKFVKVTVDGADLAAANYEVKEGSTVVTLKADYTKGLSVGEHTLVIVSNDGTASTTFTVSAPTVSGDDTSSPKTGDTNNLSLWIALMFVAGLGVAGTAVVKGKKREK